MYRHSGRRSDDHAQQPGDHQPVSTSGPSQHSYPQDRLQTSQPPSTRRGSRNTRHSSSLEDDSEDEGSLGDSEDPVIPRRTARRLPTLPKARQDQQNILLVCAPLYMSSSCPKVSQRNVRDHARLLMNREDNNQPFDEALIPSEEEVSQFIPRLHDPCCTATFFRPNLIGKTRTPWNRSAAKVFVRSFLESGQYTCTDKRLIEEAFFSHLKYLRGLYKQRDVSEDRKRAFRRKANRAERKRQVSSVSAHLPNSQLRLLQLFYRRLKNAASYHDLNCHVNVLRLLGPEGMSSDESDHENGVVQYRVLIKSWRHPILTPFLRVFDASYRRDRFVPILQNTQGSHPHLRLSSNKVDDSRGAPTRLPINAYDTRWLANLTQFDRERLEEGDPYDFSHTPHILE